MTLRTRILLSLAPLAVLLVGMGAAGFVILDRTAGRIDAILRENYVSVQAMYRLHEAVERIDTSFQLALAGRDADAAKRFDAGWMGFDAQFELEAANVTIHPAEDELVASLRAFRAEYRESGKRFFALPAAERPAAYSGLSGLRDQFETIQSVSGKILLLNQGNMEMSRDSARLIARLALVAFGVGLAGAAVLLTAAGWFLLRAILRPIREVTDAAHAIGHSGQLDRTVPVFGRDELGRLAVAFNAMTAELRKYRRSNLDRLMRAQKTAQATIDSFPDPVLVLDPSGRADLANPAARALFGTGPAGDSEPGPVWQPPDSLRQPVADALGVQRLFQTDQFDQAVSFRFNGDDRTYLPQVRPIRDPDGSTLGAAVVLNDVTRFRLLDQIKTDLVATVSHELKTPLTSVRLAVHVLLEETVGPLTPKQTELLLDARDSAERLLALIEQLLALAELQRPEQGEMRPEDPAELLRRAADDVRPRAEDKHIAVVVDASDALPAVAADAGRMGQALGNLLNNAVTYTPPGGTITLTAAHDGDRVVLTVADTGVGIPAKHLPQVFDRFFRIPGQRDEAGTGLGLSIVREIVTAHKGEITCASEPGRGTTFRITLPVEGSHGHLTRAPARNSSCLCCANNNRGG